MACMHRFNKELTAFESRVENIETKMGEFATTINNLVDASEDKDQEMYGVKMKLTDIEDRSRMNNLQIRGVSESIQQADLKSFAIDMFKDILLNFSDIDFRIDRIQHLPKPEHLPSHIPRYIEITHLPRKRKAHGGHVQKRHCPSPIF